MYLPAQRLCIQIFFLPGFLLILQILNELRFIYLFILFYDGFFFPWCQSVEHIWDLFVNVLMSSEFITIVEHLQASFLTIDCTDRSVDIFFFVEEAVGLRTLYHLMEHLRVSLDILGTQNIIKIDHFRTTNLTNGHQIVRVEYH